MIFNADKNDYKVDLKLKSGWLPYSSTTVYLGSLFTDSGIIADDITQHSLNKNKNVSVKLANFITNNSGAPITVKTKVLQSCVTATLLYSSET